jgi:hypothetical protein
MFAFVRKSAVLFFEITSWISDDLVSINIGCLNHYWKRTIAPQAPMLIMQYDDAPLMCSLS